MSEMVTLWLVVLIVSIGVEVATLGLTSIWFAGGAVVAVIAAALQAPIWLQILLFFAVSLLLLFFTRPIAVRYFNRDRVRTNVESMIGRQAIVTSEIDNLQGIGQVTVGGQEWSARTEKDGLNLQPGTVVDIVAVNGVKLIVKVDPQMAKVTEKYRSHRIKNRVEPIHEGKVRTRGTQRTRTYAEGGKMIVLIIIAVLVLWIFVSCIKIVPQAQAYVIERLGAYQATWNVGFNLKIPFVDKVARKVNLKEQVADFPPQPVITKDNVTMRIDTVVFLPRSPIPSCSPTE